MRSWTEISAIRLRKLCAGRVKEVNKCMFRLCEVEETEKIQAGRVKTKNFLGKNQTNNANCEWNFGDSWGVHQIWVRFEPTQGKTTEAVPRNRKKGGISRNAISFKFSDGERENLLLLCFGREQLVLVERWGKWQLLRLLKALWGDPSLRSPSARSTSIEKGFWIFMKFKSNLIALRLIAIRIETKQILCLDWQA